MTVLLHLSDPHFGTEVPAVLAALKRLVQAERPALVIASGDITQRATAAQFVAARAFFDALGTPRLVLPGNHDIPLFDWLARCKAPYARWQRAFGAALEPRAVLPQAWIAGLNTTRWWRHKHGQIERKQAEASAAWLHDAPRGVLRIAVTHHPLALQRAEDEPDHLRGGREAAQIWAAAGVHLVLGGHIHLPYFMPVETRWPELPRRLWLAQAGTACSSRVRPEAGHSVNLIRQQHAGTQWRLERWDHDPGRAAFVPRPETTVIDIGSA
jgi:3',5'-cyclic AMP phosphodiesterase CpdA